MAYLLKIAWITKLNRGPFLQECLYAALCPILKDEIWNYNIACKDASFFENSYWQQILTAWRELNFKDPRGKQNTVEQIIWYNSNIKIENKIFLFKAWYLQFIYIGDLFNASGNFVTFNFVKERCPAAKWFEYLSLRSSIPPMWKYWIRENVFYPSQMKLLDKVKDYVKHHRSCTKLIYDLLIDDMGKTMNKYWQ